MKMIRKYLSLFMFLAILFPIGDKAMHDIEHFNEDQCAVKETHYCRSEHLCTICDYVFSSSSNPPTIQNKILFFGQLVCTIVSLTIFEIIILQKFTFTLRGPPFTSKFL